VRLQKQDSELETVKLDLNTTQVQLKSLKNEKDELEEEVSSLHSTLQQQQETASVLQNKVPSVE